MSTEAKLQAIRTCLLSVFSDVNHALGTEGHHTNALKDLDQAKTIGDPDIISQASSASEAALAAHDAALTVIAASFNNLLLAAGAAGIKPSKRPASNGAAAPTTE